MRVISPVLSPKKGGIPIPPLKQTLSGGRASLRKNSVHHKGRRSPAREEGMNLVDVVAAYASRRDLCRNYERHLMRTAERMTSAGMTSVADMTPDRISRWLHSLTCSRSTRSNYRRQACTIVRAAMGADAGHFIDGVPRVKVFFAPPVAWTQDEMRRLLQSARELPGNLMSGCPASTFFLAWVHLGYASGLRFSDLLYLKVDQIRDGRVYITQRKTGDALTVVLPNECARILNDLSVLSPDGTVFKWALSERWLRIRWKRLVQGAGLRGTCKWLRRTGATWVEAAQPGMASKFLGHRSPELAMKHYCDRSLLPNACPSPPPIS